MATTRPFAYNTGSTISATTQIGDLAIGTNDLPVSEGYGGVIWKNGADEDLGYVIGYPNFAGTQPLPVSGTGFVQFWRSEDLTEGTFISLAEYIANFSQTFATGNDAKTWLESNGYWTSFGIGCGAASKLMELDSTTGITSNIWADISGNGRNATLYNDYALATFNGNQVVALSGTTSFVIPISGFGNDMDTCGLTYEIWAYPTKTQNGTLIAEWSGFPPTGWNDAQLAFVGGKINGGVFPDNFSPNPYIQGPNFSVNTWYYIVLTYDPISGNLKLYVNGSLISTTNGVKANPPATTLTLGRPDTANSYLGGATGYFKGYIGQWRVWNGAISQAQVTNFFNSRKSLYGL
jgi:hypothetical protein